MYEYSSATGTWKLEETPLGTGYSGCVDGRNNQTLEWMPDVGPIPRGLYRVSKSYTSKITGPLTFALIPEGHSACGRTGFRIHGDNSRHDASKGCIVLDHALRVELDKNTPAFVRVV